MIAYNNFEFNTGAYDLEDRLPKAAVMTVDARNNWWGTTSGTAIQGRIFDFNDDYTIGSVLYTPVLSAAAATAPAYVRSVILDPPSPVGIQTVTFEVLFSRKMNPEVAPQVAFVSPIVGWTTRTPMPAPRAWLAAATAPNGKIYAIGGGNLSGYLTTVEEFMPWFTYSGFYGGSWPAPDRYRTQYDFTALIPRGTYTLTIGAAVGGDGIAIALNSAYTFTVDYAGYINDTSPPATPMVTACAAHTPDTLSATWSAQDPESAVDRYQYAIGLTPGGIEVVNWTFTTLTEVTRANLSLIAGQTYYLSVKARNEAGLWSEAGSVGVVAGSGTCESNQTPTPTMPLADWCAVEVGALHFVFFSVRGRLAARNNHVPRVCAQECYSCD